MKIKEYQFLYEYSKCKRSFVKPSFKWFFGRWRNEHNLPVWRRGPQIKLSKNYSDYETEYYGAKLVNSSWTETGKENHPILSKLFKHPVIQLPIWLAFHWWNSDIVYKTKWTESDFRYEFPAHLELVFFGLAISVTAYFPMLQDDNWGINDDYWESILTYNYFDGDIKRTNDELGYAWTKKDGKNIYKFIFRPEFLKKKSDRKLLKEIQEEAMKEILAKEEQES